VVAAFFFSYWKLNRQGPLQILTDFGKFDSLETRDQVMEFTNPWIEAGKHQGRKEGEADLMLRHLTRRIGTIIATEEKAIRKLPLPKIEALCQALLDFSEPADLAKWVKPKI
jgi:hypothetical protein